MNKKNINKNIYLIYFLNTKLSTESIKNIFINIKNYYVNLNENYKIFRYGKYISIPIVSTYIIYKKYNQIIKYLNCPDDYKIYEIQKAKLCEELLKTLTEKEKEEFLEKSPEIIIDGRNPEYDSYYELKGNNLLSLSDSIKEKINKIFHYDKYFNKFYKNYKYEEIKKNIKNKTIYGTEIEHNNAKIYQSDKYDILSPTYFKCPVTSSELAIIGYYFKLKKNNQIKLISNLYKNLNLLSVFLDELLNKEVEKLLKDTIGSDFTEFFSNPNTIIIGNKVLKSFKDKKINMNLDNNITDDKMDQIIKLVFDKISFILQKSNNDMSNIFNHIGSPFYTLWIFQMFNSYLLENNLPLLPKISINMPIITPRHWCTLNPFNNSLDLKCNGGHFRATYFTLNKKDNEEFKKFIENWVRKYYILNNNLHYTLFEIYEHKI